VEESRNIELKKTFLEYTGQYKPDRAQARRFLDFRRGMCRQGPFSICEDHSSAVVKKTSWKPKAGAGTGRGGQAPRAHADFFTLNF